MRRNPLISLEIRGLLRFENMEDVIFENNTRYIRLSPYLVK